MTIEGHSFMGVRKAVFFRLSGSLKEPAKEWLENFTDIQAKARIFARISRAEKGNFGDFRPVGEGVFEFRFHFGSGYRLYFGFDGDEIILLLIGGDKSTQRKDILKAINYWKSYLEDHHA